MPTTGMRSASYTYIPRYGPMKKPSYLLSAYRRQAGQAELQQSVHSGHYLN
jgi:hypothetical protein